MADLSLVHFHSFSSLFYWLKFTWIGVLQQSHQTIPSIESEMKNSFTECQVDLFIARKAFSFFFICLFLVAHHFDSFDMIYREQWTACHHRKMFWNFICMSYIHLIAFNILKHCFQSNSVVVVVVIVIII